MSTCQNLRPILHWNPSLIDFNEKSTLRGEKSDICPFEVNEQAENLHPMKLFLMQIASKICTDFRLGFCIETFELKTVAWRYRKGLFTRRISVWFPQQYLYQNMSLNSADFSVQKKSARLFFEAEVNAESVSESMFTLKNRKPRPIPHQKHLGYVHIAGGTRAEKLRRVVALIIIMVFGAD